MIKLNNATKIYQSFAGNVVEALKNIQLEIDSQGFVFILGKSGSGKSTLLNILAGLDTLSFGTVYVDGEDISQKNEKARADYRNLKIGFVFQDFNIVEAYTVSQNLKFVCDMQGKKVTDELIVSTLSRVGLEDYQNHLGSQLSGGQKQRLALARALIKNPVFIFADEPTGNLDSTSADSILKLLKEISKNKLVIVVSHDPDDALKYGDRIIRIKDGQIASDEKISLTHTIISDTTFLEPSANRFYSIHYAWMQLRHRMGQSLMTVAILSISLILLFLLETYLSFITNPTLVQGNGLSLQELLAISNHLITILSIEQSLLILRILYAIIVALMYVVYSASMDLRVKEFAIYTALGARRSTIYSLLFWESSFYILISIIIASLIGFMFISNMNVHFFNEVSILTLNLFRITSLTLLMLFGSFVLNSILYASQMKKNPMMDVLKGE